MKSTSTHARTALVVWVAVLVAASMLALRSISGPGWLHSNVFELLPGFDSDPTIQAAMKVVDDKLGTQLIFFIGHRDRQVAALAADRFAARLLELPSIDSVTSRVDESRFKTLWRFFHPFRRQILTEAQISGIETDPVGIETAARARLYSPFRIGGGLGDDPFGLFPGSLRALQPMEAALTPDGGHLWTQKGEVNYVFVLARTDSSKLPIAGQRRLVRDIDTAIGETRRAFPELEILKTGFAFYADDATTRAEDEVSTIGLGSLVGVLLLVVVTFRSLKPLTLVVATALSGCLIGIAVTLSVFGFVHLFTLVFGASLIGVSVDYSFHYVANMAFGDAAWTPRLGMRRIFMGITLGLLTSIFAYLALTVAPFPGLQQLAVFSTSGLAGSYFTLLCVFRFWRRRIRLSTRSLVPGFSGLVLRSWQRLGPGQRYTMAGVIAVLIVAGLPMARMDDDVSALQSEAPALRRQEVAIQDMLGVSPSGTFLLARASSAQALLQAEEDVRGRLDEMIAAGTLSGYDAVSRWVPSRSRQERSYEAYVRLVRTRLPHYFETLGMSARTAADTVDDLTGQMVPLAVDAWLESPVSEQSRDLWLRTADGAVAAIILVYGVADFDRLKAAVGGFDSISVVNKPYELSRLFGKYRVRVVEVLVAAYMLILAGLSVRYGPRGAVLVLAPPVAAGLLALALLALAGEALNLFHFLAMILVLGIGIDFSIFIAEARGEFGGTMFAITLSALTTMLSFGLLSLSDTYAVHSFGVTVLIGIGCAYLLSPLAMQASPRSGSQLT